MSKEPTRKRRITSAEKKAARRAAEEKEAAKRAAAKAAEKAEARAAKEKEKQMKELAAGYFDYNLLAIVIILTCFGLIMLYSASSYSATSDFGNDMKYFTKQGIISAGAILLALIISRIDYHILVRTSPVWYCVALLLMLLVKYSPFGITINGAKRWLGYGGISFQPAEVAKIAVILTLSSCILNLGRNIRMKRNFWFLIFIVLIQGFGAYYLTDNLSTALIIMGIGILLIFLYRPVTALFIGGFSFLAAAVAAGLIYLRCNPALLNTESFRLGRILVWFDPEKYSANGGYQVMQGLYAIGSGGFFGKGLGNSIQKLTKIPEAQNDMIFSIIVEELGLFGAVLLMLIFGYLLYRLFFIAQNAPDLHGSIIASGIMFHFALQIILNICVVLNVIPTTGVSLPFVSYGGTSVLFLMIEIGIALNISKQIRSIPAAVRTTDGNYVQA